MEEVVRERYSPRRDELTMSMSVSIARLSCMIGLITNEAPGKGFPVGVELAIRDTDQWQVGLEDPLHVFVSWLDEGFS